MSVWSMKQDVCTKRIKTSAKHKTRCPCGAGNKMSVRHESRRLQSTKEGVRVEQETRYLYGTI
eukprot:1153961-Pelagomonas_calceolata.AAC.14